MEIETLINSIRQLVVDENSATSLLRTRVELVNLVALVVSKIECLEVEEQKKAEKNISSALDII